MTKDRFSAYLTASVGAHSALLILLYLNIFSLHFDFGPTEIEVALCGIGDLEKEMGGTGEGKQEEAQPLESAKITIDESEIEENESVDEIEEENTDIPDKTPDGNNKELPPKPEEKALSGAKESKPEDIGADEKTEDSDSNKDVPEQSSKEAKEETHIDQKIEPKTSQEKPASADENIVDKNLEPDENKLAEEEKRKKEAEEKARQKEEEEKRKKEEERKKKEEKEKEEKRKQEKQIRRKIKRRMIADLLAEQNKEDKINEDFDKLLSGVSDKDLGIKKSKRNVSSKVKGQGGGNGGKNLQNNDFGFIKEQISRNWNIPVSVQNSMDIVIDLEISLNDDGSVNSVVILDQNRYNSDTFYRVAADSTKKAVLLSSPLKIPRGRINEFRKFVIKFFTKDALR